MSGVPSGVSTLLSVTFLLTIAYIVLLALYALAMAVVAVFEGRSRRRQDHVEDYESVVGSRYTIPVSIVTPLFNEELMAVPGVRSLLAQSYPEFEVIAVDDGSTDGTLAALTAAFDLEPRQVFFRSVLGTKPVHMMYRSRSHPRLTVVSKDNGGKADALNCGVNFARYRYLCCVDADTLFTPDALLKAMTLVARDPARVVGVASLFGISVEPEAALTAPHAGPTSSGHALGDFQHLDMMRAFVAYRGAWSRLDCMLCVSGAFGLWRRDVIVEVGGFSPRFSCEDIEMTFRVHERFLREGRPYRIMSLPNLVAQTEGPKSIRSLVSQRARWQRVTLETIWHYRRMLGRRRYGVVGMLGVPYYALFECLAPVFQTLSVVALVGAIAFGALSWPTYLAFVGAMAFGTALPTTLAVSLHDRGYRDYRVRDLIRMLLMSPLDLLFYRPIIMYAGLLGTWQFLRGEKGWKKFDRNVRSSNHAAAQPVRGRPAAQGALLALGLLVAASGSAVGQTGGSASNDVDAIMAYALTLRRENRKPEAAAEMDRALALAPERADVRSFRDLLEHEVHGTEVMLSVDYRRWAAFLSSWREAQLSLHQNTVLGSGIVRFSHVRRADLRDEKVELEAYPAFRRGYAALGVGFAPGATIYPGSTLSAELFRSVTDRIEASAGYRRMNFDSPVDVLTGSTGLYYRSLLLGARVNHILHDGTSLLLSVRRYMTDDGQYMGLVASTGSAPVLINAPADFESRFNRSVGVEALFILSTRWVLTAHWSLGQDGLLGGGSTSVSAGQLGIGARF